MKTIQVFNGYVSDTFQMKWLDVPGWQRYLGMKNYFAEKKPEKEGWKKARITLEIEPLEK